MSRYLNYDMSGADSEHNDHSRIPEEILRKQADEWLGTERSFEELPVWEQRALLADIEEDLLQLRLVTITESENFQ